MVDGLSKPLEGQAVGVIAKGLLVDLMAHKSGADVNARNEYGRTPLHCAARFSETQKS